MFNDANDTDGSNCNIPEANSIDGKQSNVEGGINASANGMEMNVPDKAQKAGTADGDTSRMDAECTCSHGVCVLRWKPQRRQ